MLLSNRVLEVYLNGNLLEGFHMDFDCKFEVDSKEPASGSLTVHGYEENMLEGGDIIIKAGYNDETFQVFEGTITEVEESFSSEGDSCVFKVVNAFGSYRRVLEPTRITKGTSLKDTLTQICKKAGLKVGTLDVPNAQITRDLGVYKYPQDVIQNLSDSFGFYYIVDNSKTLHCYSSPSNTAVVLDAGSGLLTYKRKWLISSVEKTKIIPDKKNPPKKSRKTTTPKKKPQTGNFFSATTLFIPDLAINHKVQVRDSDRDIFLEGMIQKMSIKLSNYSDSWYCELEEVKVI